MEVEKLEEVTSMGIYIWGTGCGASEIIERGMELEKITAFVDSFPMSELR